MAASGFALAGGVLAHGNQCTQMLGKNGLE
jgi:hypothetical protein